MDGFVKDRYHVRGSHDPILDKGRTDDLPDHIRSGAARRRAAFSHEWPSAVSGQSHPCLNQPGCTARGSECAGTTVGIVRSRRLWREGAEDQNATAEPVGAVQFPSLVPSGFQPGLAGRPLSPLDSWAAERTQFPSVWRSALRSDRPKQLRASRAESAPVISAPGSSRRRSHTPELTLTAEHWLLSVSFRHAEYHSRDP
jgi:hypothetical protein